MSDAVSPIPVPTSGTGTSNNNVVNKPLAGSTSTTANSNVIKSEIKTQEKKETLNSHEKDLLRDEIDDDNESVLVIILQCETKSCDANISNLKWAFSDPYFTVQVCAVDPPTSIPQLKTLTQSQYIDNYNMRKALTYAAEGPYFSNEEGVIESQAWWNNMPVIVIKDSSITNLTPFGWKANSNLSPEEAVIGGMKHRIKTAIDRAHQADLFFLCKWNDACDKYIDVDGSNQVNHGSSLKWSTQPTATQAIMYSPAGRDYVRNSLSKTTAPLSDLLNSHIARGEILATVFVPNIIDYDVDLATSNEDYAKLNECAPPQAVTEGTTNSAALVWLILIIIIVILVAWALVQLSPTTNTR